MFCQQCGANQPDTAKFCAQCGTGLISAETSDHKTPNVSRKLDQVEQQVAQNTTVAGKSADDNWSYSGAWAKASLWQKGFIILLFILSGIGFLTKHFGEVGDGQSNKSSFTSVADSSTQSRLRDLAIKDLHTGKYSGARPEALCDVVSDEVYAPISYGMTHSAPEISGEGKPLPAIVMRHQYTCINRTFGTKEPQNQWVILALDDEFKMVRCLRTGPLFIVFGVANTCAFEPDGGKSPFPSPAEIANTAPEIMRAGILAQAQAKAATASVSNSPSTIPQVPGALVAPAGSGGTDLSTLVNKQPDQAFENPVLKTKFVALLGEKLKDFKDRLFGVAGPIWFDGHYYVGSGCIPHSCRSDDAIFSVDKESGHVVAAIVTDGKLIQIFGVSSASELPAPLQKWYTEEEEWLDRLKLQVQYR